jgi:hypothetical protein
MIRRFAAWYLASPVFATALLVSVVTIALVSLRLIALGLGYDAPLAPHGLVR